ncbi:hypothetical protein FRC10_008558 [Ceratobasidium sp. 414]|nr:hypothetical protein FRC10_008558 [Ceratobasidium sp. 414]
MVESSPVHVNGLPTEVLSLIFTTVVSTSLFARFNDKSYGTIDSPTLLASICTHWRHIAISIPALWSFIDFTRTSDSLGNLEHVKLYVARSQDSPEHWDQLFRPLNALHLDRLPINPRYLSCRNLVELHMTFLSIDPVTSAGPTVVQIRQLLDSNPNLRSVKLSGSDIRAPASIGTQQIHLPALRRFDLSNLDDTFMNWLLTSLVPGSHELELYLGSSHLHRVDEIPFKNAIIAFFQRTPVKLLHISGRWILLPPILMHLPHLECLSLSVYDFDRGTLDGIEDLASTLVNLRTVELNECNSWDYSQLDPGLKTLLTFPSVRQIRHLRCGDAFAPGIRERFCKLLSEDPDITAHVIETPELAGEMCPSPFR